MKSMTFSLSGSQCQAAGITPTHCTVLTMKPSEAILTLSVYSLKCSINDNILSFEFFTIISFK